MYQWLKRLCYTRIMKAMYLFFVFIFLAVYMNTGTVVAEAGWFELEWDNVINPNDISRMGILDLTSIEQLLAVLPDEQVKNIIRINLTEENIKSFKGIERFTN